MKTDVRIIGCSACYFSSTGFRNGIKNYRIKNLSLEKKNAKYGFLRNCTFLFHGVHRNVSCPCSDGFITWFLTRFLFPVAAFSGTCDVINEEVRF